MKIERKNERPLPKRAGVRVSAFFFRKKPVKTPQQTVFVPNENGFSTFENNRIRIEIDMNMNNQNRRGIPVGISLLAALLMAVMLLTCACGGGNRPAGEENGTRDTTAAVVNDGSEPAEQATEPNAESDATPDAEGTVPEEGTAPADTDTSPAESEPTETEGSTEPAEPESETQSAAPTYLLFEQYQALSGAEQLEYFQSFGDPEAFFLWYNAAVADFQERNPGVEIAPGGVFPAP
jgi:hypothetical protein